MVSCLRTKKENTLGARKFLLSKNWFDKAYQIGHSGKYVFLPIIEQAKHKQITNNFPGTIEQRNLEKVEKKIRNLKDALGNILPLDKIDQINRGFEAVGDIAIIEIPPEVENLETSIAWTLKRIHKNINVVVKKGAKVKGKYRLRRSKVLVGENRTTTIHKESGVQIKIDINKSYFSSKMGAERIRLSKLVKPKENILVMFSGVGPCGLVLAKQHPTVKVTMVELNPSAVKLAKENIKLNKLEKRVIQIKGDAKKEVPKLNEKFNRIIMVLPETAHEFLPEALHVAARNCTIHLYQFEHEDNVKKRTSALKQMVEKLDCKVKSIKPIRSGYFGPKINRYCFDINLDRK
jgi:tRNA (guanine37-N1)-methyltransferase